MKWIYLVLLFFSIVGCANIPVMTMLKFSGFDEGDFLSVDASQIKVKVRLEHPAALIVESKDLELKVESTQGIRIHKFPLMLLNEENIAADEGFFFSTNAATQYMFKLEKEGLENFTDVQESLLQTALKRTAFTIAAKFDHPSESPKIIVI